MRLQSSDWAESLKGCLSEKRNLELGRLTRQEAFSKNKSPLYFVELLKFLKRSGQYDGMDESVGSIYSAMQIVNQLRIDAHAKDIDERNYGALLDALTILETVFVPPS